MVGSTRSSGVPLESVSQANAGHVSLGRLSGDVGDRELPHGSARRARGALPGLRLHDHYLQQLPQPALPEVSGGGGKGMAG